MAGKFELFSVKHDKFRFRLKAANGETIASSEKYESKAAARKGIASIKANAPTAEVIDLDAVAAAKAKAAAKAAAATAKASAAAAKAAASKKAVAPKNAAPVKKAAVKKD